MVASTVVPVSRIRVVHLVLDAGVSVAGSSVVGVSAALAAVNSRGVYSTVPRRNGAVTVVHAVGTPTVSHFNAPLSIADFVDSSMTVGVLVSDHLSITTIRAVATTSLAATGH